MTTFEGLAGLQRFSVLAGAYGEAIAEPAAQQYGPPNLHVDYEAVPRAWD